MAAPEQALDHARNARFACLAASRFDPLRRKGPAQIATARLEGVDRLRLRTNDNETQQALVADIGRLTRTDLDELQQVIDRRYRTPSVQVSG